MLMNIPWTVYYTDPAGKHAVKNVLAPANINQFSSKDIAGMLALDDLTVQFLTKGHHESVTYGVHDEQ